MRDATKRNPDHLETADFATEKRNQRPMLRRQKGWKGFVWGYKDRSKVFDKVWHTINWGKDGELSGAKEIIKDGNKTTYKF